MRKCEPTCWILDRIRHCDFHNKWFTDGVYFILHETTARKRWRFHKDFDEELILKPTNAPNNFPISQLDYFATVGVDAECSIKAVFVKKCLDRFSVAAIQDSDSFSDRSIALDWKHCSVWLTNYGLRVICTEPRSNVDKTKIYGGIAEIVLVVNDFYVLQDAVIDASDLSHCFWNYCMQSRFIRETARKVLYKIKKDAQRKTEALADTYTLYFSAISELDVDQESVYCTPNEVDDENCLAMPAKGPLPAVHSTAVRESCIKSSGEQKSRIVTVRSARIQTNSKITGWTNSEVNAPESRTSNKKLATSSVSVAEVNKPAMQHKNDNQIVSDVNDEVITVVDMTSEDDFVYQTPRVVLKRCRRADALVEEYQRSKRSKQDTVVILSSDDQDSVENDCTVEAPPGTMATDFTRVKSPSHSVINDILGQSFTEAAMSNQDSNEHDTVNSEYLNSDNYPCTSGISGRKIMQQKDTASLTSAFTLSESVRNGCLNYIFSKRERNVFSI